MRGCRLIARSLEVQGFKSLRDVRIELMPGINVVVGPNASGKSNIVDLFLFLRKALYDELGRVPYAPHLPWGDPRNLTWETSGLPVRVAIEYELVLEKDVRQTVIYEVVFGLEEGATLKPIEEYIRVPVLNAALLRRGRRIDVYLSRRWGRIEQLGTMMKKAATLLGAAELEIRCDARGCYAGATVEKEFTSIFQLVPITYEPLFEALSDVIREFRDLTRRLSIRFYRSLSMGLVLPWPRILNPCLELNRLLLVIRSFFARIVALRLIDYYRAKWPHRPSVRDRLEPDASNLAEVIYTLLNDPEKRGKLESVVRSLFPWLRFSVEFDAYGNIVLKFYEERGGRLLELHPAMVPEGVIKLLTVMTGILLEPSILVIDEIEDSMHARMIERLFDELRGLETPVILTTHSPVIVDLAGPERLIVLRRGSDGATIAERVREPQKLRKMLEEEGVTLGYYYLHALPEEDTA
ncbi:AAA family ATPase [Pyrolobus fumarii]|uniref:AAA family ATPase n=1 Tax=Pyrolobus fumarii TaxID=54252 RepID=UPI001432AF52|nr:ATP-binding protein [Pyrolobus fumarii]